MTTPVSGPDTGFEPPKPQFHLMVIATSEVLPQPLEILHPTGDGGALTGVPIPMGKDSGSLHLLRQPMAQGHYAFESEQGVVIATVSPRNPGDSYPGQSAPGDDGGLLGVGPEERQRLENGRWTVILELLESKGDIIQAVLFQTELADRLGHLGEGAILDWEGCRGYLPGQWRDGESPEQFDIREHVAAHIAWEEGGDSWIHTHGLAKFGRPEMEIRAVPEELKEAAVILLWGYGDYVARGAVIKPGETVGEMKAPLHVRLADERSANHYPSPSLELVDVGGDGLPVERGATRGLEAIIESAST